LTGLILLPYINDQKLKPKTGYEKELFDSYYCMKSLLILITSLFYFSPAFSQWQDIASDKDSTVYYINPQLVSNVKDSSGHTYLKVWIKSTSPEFEDVGGKKYKDVETKTLYYIDCVKIRIRILSSTHYKPTGEVISSFKFPLDDAHPWQDVEPGSIAEAITTKICALGK
jgi:hypothetical protein